jgi:hypothetical protein
MTPLIEGAGKVWADSDDGCESPWAAVCLASDQPGTLSNNRCKGDWASAAEGDRPASDSNPINANQVRAERLFGPALCRGAVDFTFADRCGVERVI